MATAPAVTPTSATAARSCRPCCGPSAEPCCGQARSRRPRSAIRHAAYWDHVVLVWYPSRRAFLDMVTSAAYAEANVHRENGVADHVILATAQTYSKIPAAK